MNPLKVTERQLHAILLPAVRYKQALLVWDVSHPQLQRLCANYPIEVSLPLPLIPPDERERVVVRLLRPAQREQAIVIPYWSGTPKPILSRVMQVRLVN